MTTAAQLIRTAAPLYRDVANALERALREGVWKPGDQFPTEPELEQRFGASRGTLRMAISELVRKGWLHRQPGRGTFVLGASFKSMERYFRYRLADSDTPVVPEHSVVKQSTVKAAAATAAALGVPVGSAVAHLRRLRHWRDQPFLVIDSYFPPEIWRGIAGADLGAQRLYDVLRDSGQVYVVSADEYLRAGLATRDEARQLHIATGSPVLRIRRIAHSFEQQPVEYRIAVGPGDRFDYHIRLE